jgi:cysteine desulfurase
MRIYLDNNATTSVHPQIVASFPALLRETFGNASSIHEEGQRARRAIEDAREALAQLLGASPREIVFTSGGTESNNSALLGAVLGSAKRCHFVTTSIEHPSVGDTLRRIEEMGHAVTRVGCDTNGVVHADAIRDALTPDTVCVAVMLANNETGVIQPVEEIGAICAESGIQFHCDADQAVGKIPVDVKRLGVTTLALSGHKFHAPKGIGALYVRSGTTLHPLITGGAQERRRRAGTETVPLAVALGEAARLVDLESSASVAELRDLMEQEITSSLPFTRVNGARAPRLPNTSSLSFLGYDAEGIVIALDLNGVAVSTGSACSSGRVEPSHVLIAMGLSEEDARSSVRLSLSRFTTRNEIERFVTLAKEIVPRNVRLTTNGVPPLHD